jgi:hypothetical protein
MRLGGENRMLSMASDSSHDPIQELVRLRRTARRKKGENTSFHEEIVVDTGRCNGTSSEG